MTTKTSIAAIMLLALVRSPSVAQEAIPAVRPAGLTNPLAIRLSNYGNYENTAFTHLPSIGIHGIFLNAPASDQVVALERRLSEHALRLLVLKGVTDLGRGYFLDELAPQIAVCEKMGVKYMFLSPRHTGVSKEVAYERLRRVGQIAKKHGVIVTLETHPDLGANAAAHLETMRQVNHPNIRVNFDTGNITYYNKGTDAVSELRKVIDYVATVELKDHDGQHMAFHFPAFGKGVVDFPAVLALLQKHHFQGPITLEVEGVRLDMNEAQTKQCIAESVAYIQALGSFK
jgi:sugar phosphate isomerase/epimerase